jgi:hypothetical protein
MPGRNTGLDRWRSPGQRRTTMPCGGKPRFKLRRQPARYEQGVEAAASQRIGQSQATHEMAGADVRGRVDPECR